MLTDCFNPNKICGLLKQRKRFVKLSRCSGSGGLQSEWPVIILAAALLDFTINLLISLLT